MSLDDASTRLVSDVGTELREGYAEVGDVRLHYVEAGDGPLIVLLHGFPEFWYGWRCQIGPLAEAGFRVVAPDMRGYNLSSKPPGICSSSSRTTMTRADSFTSAAHGCRHRWQGTIATPSTRTSTVVQRSNDPNRSCAAMRVPGRPPASRTRSSCARSRLRSTSAARADSSFALT